MFLLQSNVSFLPKNCMFQLDSEKFECLLYQLYNVIPESSTCILIAELNQYW